MDQIEIDVTTTPELDDPILVEGLPGIGLVGKLAVDHLGDQLESHPVCRIYSEHFPPAVSIDEDGRAELASLAISAVRTEGRDLLLLAGDTQAQEAIGQYRVAASILDRVVKWEVHEVVTIGGFGVGEQIEEYSVLGATAGESPELRDRLRDAGVDFDDDRLDNIVGMSGLLVGLGARRGIDTAGLLGTTPGYHVDPASARAVLDVLQAAFGFEVDLGSLAEQAEEMQEAIDQIQSAQQPESGPESGELRYFE